MCVYIYMYAYVHTDVHLHLCLAFFGEQATPGRARALLPPGACSGIQLVQESYPKKPTNLNPPITMEFIDLFVSAPKP